MYLVDSPRHLVASYRYDPFGNTISSSGTLATANIYRFSSKEIHATSGLYYYGYRFYDPNLQRWLNRDPIQEQGGFNLYGFVGNSPLNRVDLLGLYLIVFPPVFVWPKPPPPPTPNPIPPPKPPPPPPSPPDPGLVPPIVRVTTTTRLCTALMRISPYLLLLTLSGDTPERIKPDPKKEDPECTWTGNTVEVIPGEVECEYKCDGQDEPI